MSIGEVGCIYFLDGTGLVCGRIPLHESRIQDTNNTVHIHVNSTVYGAQCPEGFREFSQAPRNWNHE